MTTTVLETPVTAHNANPNSLEVNAAKKFIFSGRAKFTLLNPESGKRFTYKVRAPKKPSDTPRHFVEVMTGSDNQSSFGFFGTVFAQKDFRFSQKAQGLTPDAPSVKAFQWLMKALMTGDLRHVQVIHSGRCGRCARELTDPVSIARGLGPECAGKE